MSLNRVVVSPKIGVSRELVQLLYPNINILIRTDIGLWSLCILGPIVACGKSRYFAVLGIFNDICVSTVEY